MKHILVRFAPALLVIVYVALMWLFWLAPNFDRLKEMDFQAQTMEEKLAVLKKQAGQLNTWRREMTDFETNSASQFQALPDEPDLIGLMASFARQAADRDLVFSSFTPGDPEAREFYIATPIRAEFSGRLNDLVGLMAASLEFAGGTLFKAYSLTKLPSGSRFRLEGQLETYHLAPERTKKQ